MSKSKVESRKLKNMRYLAYNKTVWALWIALLLPGSCTVHRFSEDQIEIVPVMERDDHLFLGDGPVGISLSVENQMGPKLKGELEVRILSDFGEELPGFSEKISLKSGEAQAIELEYGLLDPGFYNASVLVRNKVSEKRHRFAFGVRPEEIVSPLDYPDDFEDYWNRAREELARVDPRFHLIRQDSLCTDKREVFILEMYSLGEVLVRSATQSRAGACAQGLCHHE